MSHHALRASLILVVAVFASGCAPQAAVESSYLVGFGPVIDGRPTGYCDPGSPILRAAELQQLVSLEMPALPEGKSLATEADMIAFVSRVLADKAPGTRFVVNTRGIADAGIAYSTPELTGNMTLERFLRACYGDYVGVGLKGDRLAVDSRDSINSDLPVAIYPVGDLMGERPALDQEYSGTQQLRDLVERTVRSVEPWESMGGRGTIDFYEWRGLMIVGQTLDGHVRVARLLASLRTLADTRRAK